MNRQPIEVSLDLAPLPFLDAGEAANDSHLDRPTNHGFTDMNLLVATAVARVTAHVRPVHVNVALELAEGQPVVTGDATAVAFAVAGVLAARLRAAEDAGEHDELRVIVREHDRHVRVLVAAHDVPPLGMVRALAGDDDVRGVDATVAHCRRLVEGLGGTLSLARCGDGLAVELSLPACPQGNSVRVMPPRRHEHSNLGRIALAS
ncbi:MAG: hypothetical protein U0168_19925 [Nannocystaceae bacterium]